MVKVSDHGRHVTSSSLVPLKTRRVGQRCTLNLSRAETSSRWCGRVCSSQVVMVANSWPALSSRKLEKQIAPEDPPSKGAEAR
ncbi:hypothetical protein TNCV_4541921 [Trichonephila clavipes]|nr:hypothetical protein TNCV_4541921 [Trichonephila clavipes]